MKPQLCVARVPASTYKAPSRCAKIARVNVLGLGLCRHHEHRGRRGGLEIWNPALERRMK